jgi:hypothetical protein
MKRTGNKLLTNVQPTFTTVPSTLPLGDQLADISMGWDGTVWSIDTKGVPHQLDPVSQTWHLFGRGFDAVARSPQSGLEMLFRGTQYSDNGSAPQAIGSTWPNLPDSFKLGVTGAANVNNVLYLFRSGRYVRVDQSTNVLSLTSLTNWPKTTNWQQGVIDAVGSDLNNAQNPQILLFRRQEFIVVDMVKKQVVSGPQPLSARFSGKLLQVMSAGFDALLFDVFGTGGLPRTANSLGLTMPTMSPSGFLDWLKPRVATSAICGALTLTTSRSITMALTGNRRPNPTGPKPFP